MVLRELLTSKGFELTEQLEEYIRYKKSTDSEHWYQLFIELDNSYLLEKCRLTTDQCYFAELIYEGKDKMKLEEILNQC